MTSASPNTAPPDPTGRAVLRIIARPVPWPDLRTKADRAGLRLRWDALTEDGLLLVAATEHPLADGAHALVVVHGVLPDQPLTLRHEGKAFDSFVPMPIAIPAAQGALRAAGRAKLAQMRASHPEKMAGSLMSGGDRLDVHQRRFSGEAHGLDSLGGADQVPETPAGRSGQEIRDWREEGAETQRPHVAAMEGGRDAQ